MPEVSNDFVLGVFERNRNHFKSFRHTRDTGGPDYTEIIDWAEKRLEFYIISVCVCVCGVGN